MVYSASFHRLVIIGTLYDDIFNTSCSIVHETGAAVDLPEVSSGLLTAVAGAVGTWWPKAIASALGGGISVSADAKLTAVKLNRIGQDGKYQDVTPREHIYPTPIAGIGSTGIPPQLTLVSTLRGTFERGAAGKGRMFWPPSSPAANVLSDGRISATTALNYTLGVKTLFQAINAAYATAGVDAVVGITSKTGTGHTQILGSITVGRVVDTMRSRRSALVEDQAGTTMP